MNNILVRFDSATPGIVVTVGAITGLQGGGSEVVAGIDFRPSNGQLYGLGIVDGAPNDTARLYVIDTTTAIATQVGSSTINAPTSGDSVYGFDFNPTVERIRVVNVNDENLRLNPFTGGVAGDDTNLDDVSTTEEIVGAAYDRNFAGANRSTLFGIDRSTSSLVLQGGLNGAVPPGPNGGVITSVGPLGVTLDATSDAGFDIAEDGTAFAALTVGGSTGLYTINLTSGEATLVGAITTGVTPISGIAVELPLAQAHSFVVTTAADGVPSSLRAAMQYANANAGTDTITFNIPGPGAHTISPEFIVLPPIFPNAGVPLEPVIIDGTTQPGFDPATRLPVIELDGSNGILIGLQIVAGNSTVRALAINRFNGDGILLAVNGGNTIEGCFIGTDVTGTVALGNVGSGVHIFDAPTNTIGGTALGAGNLISGNNEPGVFIEGANATGNLVQGNRIGTDLTGTTALANSEGVFINDGSNNTIGGTVAGAGNLISGNSGNGVDIQDTGAPGATTGNKVQGNFIGTNAAGTAALGNGFGVAILSGTANTVGGTTAAARNVISGNSGSGVTILNASATGNLVQGNFIGTDVNGTAPLGNGSDGVRVDFGPFLNTIGGTDPGAGNIIAFNNNGVAITEGNSISILSNSIHSNTLLGIDLGTDGVTPNDANDVDTGPNDLQNFPTITAVTSSGGTTTIDGSLNSEPSSSYRLEFFANDAPDSSGNGEGKTFLGQATVNTDGAGNASFSAEFPVTIFNNQTVAGTATASGSTSEFSANTSVDGPDPTPGTGGQLRNISTRLRVEAGDNQGIGGFIITGSAPKRVIVRALGPSLTQFDITGFLADPILELHGGAGELIFTNDDWRDTQEAEIQATNIPPLEDAESAIVATLPVGNYTGVMGGAGGTSGVALIEVYDLDDPGGPSQLANLSTRGKVQTGSNVVIGGFILGGGSDDSNVIVRGIGPSLASAGLSDILADPTLELRDGDGALLFSNDDWADDPAQAAIITAAGLPPQDEKESAIATTRPPGLYTVILRGKSGGTGIGLVEIYHVP